MRTATSQGETVSRPISGHVGIRLLVTVHLVASCFVYKHNKLQVF